MNEIKLGLPDGTVLRAVACPDSDFPAINLYWTNRETGLDEEICFSEYNPEQSPCHNLCIGVYQSDQDDTTYYKPYMAERNVI